ncbi:MFS transporter [Anaeromassilibacillus sp. SJQ-1]|uniref:MFS transporter n=1 Tax=Anaeromassilibacillus sp. SJQ-1 TaxID=3375419 RepID=UPI003988CDC3
MYQKLMNRDFSLVVIGQIISLFGNSILRFALPLYLLDQTGSSALFGSVLAISMIPMILFSPIAGMVADRVNRRNIMVILDFSTAALVAVFGLLNASGNPAVLVAIMLICLSVIQAFYQPAVQASIPVLSSTNNLLRANAIINQVQSLSNLIGPILGGMLYSVWGVVPVIWASAASFLFSAVMEIFIHIPFEKRAASGGILTTAVNDLKESLHFMIRERPVILRVVIFVSLFNLALSSLITVGVPSMVKITLHLSSSLYSLTQVLLAAGALCGGILAGILAPKLSLRNMHWVLLLASPLPSADWYFSGIGRLYHGQLCGHYHMWICLYGIGYTVLCDDAGFFAEGNPSPSDRQGFVVCRRALHLLSTSWAGALRVSI